MEQLFGDCACVCLDDADGERSRRTTCNPFMQAEVLNQAQCDLNVNVGLCLGHDMIFARHSQAWVTTLEIKDQSTKHELAFLAALKRYRAVEQLRQDLCDQVALESMGGCGSQLVSVQGVRGASEEQLLNMARKEGPLPSRYGLE